MRVKEAIAAGAKELKKIAQRPYFESELLLSHCFGIDRIDLHKDPERELPNYALKEFFSAIKRRSKGYPIEYITQRVSFYSLEFYIHEGVLIPRPETELLVEKALELPVERVAEIGVGSGAVSVALALNNDKIRIVATDISKKAVKLARKNVARYSLSKRIEIRECAFLDCVEEEIDLIVSNPPYIKRGVELEKPVTFEPPEALFAGEEGDEIIKNIVSLALDRGVAFLICEIGYDQKESVEKHCRQLGLDPKFYKDYAGWYRGFVIDFKKERG